MKIIKLIFGILLIVGILFFGGAILLPSQQYYATTVSLETDPVAIYNKINEVSALKIVSPYPLKKSEDSIVITSTERYKSVQYEYISTNDVKSYKSGFNIEEEDRGTKLTWFYVKDSLEFPLNRWRGFFEARVVEEKMENNLQHLEKIINN